MSRAAIPPLLDRGRYLVLVALSRVGNTPDGTAGIISDKQRSVFGDGKRGRTSPNFRTLFAGYPEPGREILIETFRPAVLERHAHDLVADGPRSIPRTFESHESVAFVFWRKLVAFIENKIKHRRMRLEQQVGGNCCLYLVRRPA